MPTQRVRVFIASSLDGFIAGEGDDLSWLPAAEPDGSDHGYGQFMAQVGALLMGRRTFDVVAGFEGPWPYGEKPVLVATRRPMTAPNPAVRAVEGSIASLLQQAKQAAGERDIYLDGGELIRQALDEGLVDELVVTLIPAILGRGHPLFAGVQQRQSLKLLSSEALAGGLVQLTLQPARTPQQG